jgi:plastocyanin
MSVRRTAALVLVMVAGLLLGAAPAAAGGGRGCHGELTDGRGDGIKAYANCFVPTVARVDVGDTVTWHTGDTIDHTVTAVAGGFSLAEHDDLLRPSSTVAATFEQPGVYPYVCLLHPGMAGAVVVGDATQVSALDTGAPDHSESDESAAAAGLGVAGAAIVLLVAGPLVLRRRRAPRV